MARTIEPPSGAGPARPEPAGDLPARSDPHQRLRSLTLDLSRRLPAASGLGSTLEALAAEANAVLGARRTSIWLHQRRSHDLALLASSDAANASPAGPVRTDDPHAPPARGLRLDRPLVDAGGDTRLLLVPLRGWRRALGTLVAEGPFAGGDPVTDTAHEIGRELAAALENIQLLDEVIRQRSLLENTFDSLLELVIAVDPSFRVVQVNEAFARRAGGARRDLLDRRIDELIGDEMAAWLTAPPAAEAASAPRESARTMRFVDERLGGTFSVTITPLAHPGGPPAGYVVVARDITRQTELEAEREALRERLAQSEKLAALGQFVAGIAHEMNNPLQGVLGHLELLLQTSADAAPLRRELRRIYQDAERAAKIVRNLMVFTGARRMTRRRLRPGRVLARALASRAAALARAGIEIVRDEAPGVPAVTGDPLLLHQALLNVIINAEHAIRSTAGRGRIHCRIVHHAATARVALTVHDSGPGIPQDVLPRIFDPFFTTKDVGQGTGLGLAITYGIIQEHGGVIHAANHRDGGAVMTIELPVAPC